MPNIFQQYGIIPEEDPSIYEAYDPYQAETLLEQGNLDLMNRPQVQNPDGSISTVRSMSIGVDGREVLIPTIGPNGEDWSPEEAIENYRKTGQHLGAFDSPESATKYAQELHNQQAAQIGQPEVSGNIFFQMGVLSANEPAQPPLAADLTSIPIREPYPSELDYFKKNPHVAGMATEDDAVILNPHSGLTPEQQSAVTMNEQARVYMRKNKIVPDFDLTPQQKADFKDYGDEGTIKQTIAARILAGDSSALDVTYEQKRWVDVNLKSPQQPPGAEYGGVEGAEASMAMDARDPNDNTTFAGAAEALARGVAEGLTVELPSMAGKALQFFTERGQEELEEMYRGVYGQDTEEGRRAYQRLKAEGRKENAGKILSDWAERKRKEWFGPVPEDMSTVEKMIYEGSKMLAPSVIPGAALNVGFRLVSGIGSTLKLARVAKTGVEFAALMREAQAAAKASSTLASAGVATMFGGAQAQDTLETALERATKLEAEGRHAEAAELRRMANIAPYITGGVEAVGEYFGTKYLGKLFGVTEAEVVKRTAKKMIIDFLKTLGVEVSTEVGQQFGQAVTEKYTGIRPEAEPLAEALQVIGPTIVMTLLTGGAAGAYNMMNRKEAAKPPAKEGEKPQEEGEPKVVGPVVPLPEQNVTVGGQYGGLPTTGTGYRLTDESKVVAPGQKPEEAKTVGETREAQAKDFVDKMYKDLNQNDLQYVYDRLPKSAAAVKAEIERRMQGGEQPQGPAYVKPEEKAEGAEEEVDIVLPEGQGGQIEQAVASVKRMRENIGLNPDDVDESMIREAKPNKDIEVYYRLMEAMGKKVTFYEADEGSGIERINGFYSRINDRIYVNSKKAPTLFILGHEVFHEMKANHPDLHAAAMKVIRENATTFDEYVKQINIDRAAAGAAPLVNDEKFWDEYGSDLSGQLFEKPKFWMDLNQSHPDLFKQLSDIVKRVIETVKRAFKDTNQRHAIAKEGVKNLEAVEAAITEAYKQMLKRKGAVVTKGRTEATAETLAKMPRAGKVKITAIHAETGQRIKVEEDAKTAIDELDAKIEQCYQVLECINANP